MHLLYGFGELERGDVLEPDIRSEPLGLLLHVEHELRALNAARESWEILNISRRHQIAARFHAGSEDERGQVGSRCINSCRVAGRAGTDDDDLVHEHS